MNSWLDDYLREHMPPAIVGDLTVETSYSTPVPRFTVQKYVAFLPVSTDLLMDEGVIPDTRPPAGRSPLSYRFRMWRSRVRERLAERAYKLISGFDFPDPDSYDD